MSTRTNNPLSERAMQIAERRFPEIAIRSGREAYKTTLTRTGAVVVKTSQGQMVERRSDGTSTIIKSLSIGKRVKPGIVLRRAK